MNLLVKLESSSDVQIKHLREQFEAIDEDNTGLIDESKLLHVVKAHLTEEEAKEIVD